MSDHETSVSGKSIDSSSATNCSTSCDSCCDSDTKTSNSHPRVVSGCSNSSGSSVSTKKYKKRKIIMDPSYAMVSVDREATGTRSKKCRPHFRIDWRQLTYYQRPESLFSRCLTKVTNLFIDQSKKHSEMPQSPLDDSSPSSGPKRILNSLDGCFKSGQLSAILGPSGAGKSTFLATLFGSKQENAFGQTKVTWFSEDGLPTKLTERRSLRIAFLPQHDHLLHHLTVYETLMFASKIKNANRTVVTDESFHRQNVKRVAKMLKISECLDTRCGKLSGGQYKRVSIGQELLSEPDVIILDEPTSGLDAMTCLTTVKTLKSIVTKHPMSIILTIHQPEIDVFNLFDQVYVIAQGGLAIYEGPPQKVAPTLASVNLHMPSPGYNPARFIVEHAFVVESEQANGGAEWPASQHQDSSSSEEEAESSGHSSDEEEFEKPKDAASYIRQSLVSLSEAISGKEMSSGLMSKKFKGSMKDVGDRRDKRPLLNIGIQTLDGHLITSKSLNYGDESHIKQLERFNLLMKLNQIQKAKYQASAQRLELSSPSSDSYNSDISRQTPTSAACTTHTVERKQVASDSSASSCASDDGTKRAQTSTRTMSLAAVAGNGLNLSADLEGKRSTMYKSMPMIDGVVKFETHSEPKTSASCDQDSIASSSSSAIDSEFVVNLNESRELVGSSDTTTTTPASNYSRGNKMSRRFDKRLSAKHNCSKKKDYPIWYHAFLLTHRTWLSIIRDPIFFGIQACMHTTIPILLAVIFGSVQDEGCPRVGSFDLVDFAYSDSDNMISGTVASIRKSIGNIGIVFFEMFVITFAINCITALVFPLDMFVLLKEYRNGWYSLRSYFFGRTLADLPVPIVLHSVGISILYYMTGQPNSMWRFCSIVLLVVIASLVAQSVGLTIGAILMRSSQSAVLAAAGIVAPFFALSGFIVRIHTLPFLAQLGAQGSYLYHLLNGFIILRYGFGRCQCKTEDFEQNAEHQIPSNLHTLASMWIGTYSNEYAGSQQVLHAAATGGAGPLANATQLNATTLDAKTNVDPNIDVVDKMMTAFKMANSYGHKINDCDDVLPYAMLDFNLRDSDIYGCFVALIVMLILSRLVTFSAIYYKIRSFT